MRNTLLLWLLMTSPPCLAASVYKSVQPDGTIVYSDRPAEGAQEVRLPELQTYTAPPLPARPETPAAKQETGSGFKGYETLAISSPANDATLRDNAGNVSVSLTLTPSLQASHSVDIRMDGQSIGKGRGTSISLTNVDRGSHTLQAVVLDATGKEVARSDSVVFHLNRASVNSPTAPQAPKPPPPPPSP